MEIWKRKQREKWDREMGMWMVEEEKERGRGDRVGDRVKVYPFWEDRFDAK